jgi:cell division transport system permease protein
VTTTVSLFFFGAGLWLNDQVETMKGYWYDRVEVSVFLCGQDSEAPTCAAGQPTQAQKDAIGEDLRSLPEVQNVFYESKQEAYDRFTDQFQDSAIAENVEPEQMPDSFRVKLVDPEEYALVSAAFRDRAGVEVVEDSRETLEKLFQALNGLQLAGFVVAGVQLLAASLMIGNTIRVAAYNRRRETGIMRLVGASSFYIRLPFVLEGAIAGLVGGLIASGALLLAQKYGVQGWLVQEFPFTPAVAWEDVVQICVYVVLLGVALSSLASFITLRRYLRV